MVAILDSGASDHVSSRLDLPGHTVEPSPGSKAGKHYTAAGGKAIPNEGQAAVSVVLPAGNGKVNMGLATFQVAEVSRPLMSVSKICDQGYACLFTKDGAQILDSNQRKVCEFGRPNGLYVANMKLKSPEPFQRPAP